MVSQNLGRVQPLYRGSYNASVRYDRLDNVLYNEETWICLVDGTQGETPSASSSKWELIAGKGGTGPQGPSGSFGNPIATASALSADAPPSVSVSASGPDTAKVFTFNFGIPAGPLGFDVNDIRAAATSNAGAATASAAIDSNGKLSFDFNIPPAEGQGATSVDDILPDGSGNVNLTAVAYGTAQALSDAQKIQARSNINAQIAGNYITNPSDKTYGQYLYYGGPDSNPTWIAKTLQEIPSGGIAGYILRKQEGGVIGWTPGREVPSGGTANAVLTKNSNTDFDYSWSPVITNSDIDEIIND